MGDCQELSLLSQIRERLHRKVSEYFVFSTKQWELSKWRQFFGATDALLDTEFALTNVVRGCTTDRKHALLFCYGYLQALYIQQDAVAVIWNALDLPGDPLADPRVQEVRELRNRVAGHPARADKMGPSKRPSSAIINVHDIEPGVGFKAVIYYDGDMDVVEVSFSDQMANNASGLSEALLKVESEMVRREAEFRQREFKAPLSAKFKQNINYTLEKLRCDPGDGRRDMALRMLRGSVDALETTLKSRNFYYEIAEYHISAIRAGIVLGEDLDTVSARPPAQHSWWVIGEGIAAHVNALLRHVCDLDGRLADPPK